MSNPRKPFWFVFDAQTDGSLDLISEAITPHDTEAEALDHAKERLTVYGGDDCFVFRVDPIARVYRPGAVVTRLDKPKAAPKKKAAKQ